jgi:hypothetical protein
MRVQKVYANSGYEFALLDDEGLAIPIVTDMALVVKKDLGRRRSPGGIAPFVPIWLGAVFWHRIRVYAADPRLNTR